MGQPEVYNNFTVSELRKKISQFVPVTVTADTKDFSQSETQVLDLLIAASKLLNPVFNRQSFELYKETREQLVKQRFVVEHYINNFDFIFTLQSGEPVGGSSVGIF